MSYIRKIEDWRVPASMGAAYERLLESVGSVQFGDAIHDWVMAATGGAQRIYLFEATGRENSNLQYFFGEPCLEAMLPAYSARFHNVDPVCDAYSAAPATSDVALQRIEPADVAHQDFRRRFFDQAGIVERVSIIQRGPSSWRVMNVSRHRSSGVFSDRELDALIGLACLALPMLPLNRRRSAARSNHPVDIEHRLKQLYPLLTGRERQVCARAAMGMSVEATALDLGVARTSVMTYRKRSYQRLGINSVHELCSLILH